MVIDWLAIAALFLGFAIGCVLFACLRVGSDADDFSEAWADGYRAGWDAAIREMK